MSGRGCDEIRALLPAQLDGDLDPAAAARVREHLEGCPSCREQRETLRLAVDALRRLPELPPPASILAGVRARLRPVPWHRRLFARRPWLVGVPVGALATALVVLGVALFQARYPQLPRVAEQRTAVPPAATKRKPAATPEHGVIALRPEPTAAAPATPTVSPAPSPTAAPTRPEAPPTRAVRTEDARPSGARFAAPQPTPEPAQALGEPRREATPAPRQFAVQQPAPEPAQVPAEPQREAAPREPIVAPFLETTRRSIVGAPAPARVPAPTGDDSRSGVPTVGAPRVGSLEARGAAPLRATPGPMAPGTGLMKSAAPRPTPEPQPRPRTSPPPPQPQTSAPVPGSVEALTVLLAAGEDFNELRQLVLRVGGRILDTRVLDPRARREAFLPHRSRVGARADISQGWKLSVGMPRRAIPGFVEELERRPGRLVLDQRTRPTATPERATGEQTLRITVLR